MKGVKHSVWTLAVALLWCTGCGRQAETRGGGAEAKAAAPAKPRIALVMKSLANEFFLTMENGARAHQQQHAAEYELLANGIKDEQDVSSQVNIVEQMISRKVDALVIAPADSRALIGVCKKALDAGIVVVNVDNKFDAEALSQRDITLPFVGPDNRKGARLAGEYLAQKLKAGDAVAILEGIPTAFNAQQRKAGFEDAARAAGLKVVSSQSAQWDMARANQVATAILTAHPEVKGLLCANDSMALGAAAALKSAGKSGQVLLAGFDNISAAQQLLREGRLLCTVDQHADQIAVFGIEYALEILREKTVPADKETAVNLITAAAP